MKGGVDAPEIRWSSNEPGSTTILTVRFRVGADVDGTGTGPDSTNILVTLPEALGGFNIANVSVRQGNRNVGGVVADTGDPDFQIGIPGSDDTGHDNLRKDLVTTLVVTGLTIPKPLRRRTRRCSYSKARAIVLRLMLIA